MADAFHDADLVMHLVTRLPVFNKSTLLDLLASIDRSMLNGRQLIDHGKSPLANIANDIVGLTTVPLHAIVILSCRGSNI